MIRNEGSFVKGKNINIQILHNQKLEKSSISNGGETQTNQSNISDNKIFNNTQNNLKRQSITNNRKKDTQHPYIESMSLSSTITTIFHYLHSSFIVM